MRGSTLIRYQVVQVREPRQKRLLTATWMVKPFHREPFPLDGVMGVVYDLFREFIFAPKCVPLTP